VSNDVSGAAAIMRRLYVAYKSRYFGPKIGVLSTAFSTALRAPHFCVGGFRGYRERSTADTIGCPF
jgi:hypothetical protein